MSTGNCSRCGRRSEMEYGSDGQIYCSSCAFYGLNKQCWRCRMYLPAAELQQYRGQWACPYCIQDMRDADRRAEEQVQERPKLERVQLPELCERCGRDLDNRVYIWNGRKLCKNCVNDEQEKWGLVGGGPMSAPYRVTLEPERKRKKESFIIRMISEFLVLLGLKKKKKIEVVVLDGKMPISRARPLAEAMMSKKGKEDRKPETEGIMKEKEPGRPPAGEQKPSPGKKRRRASSIVPKKTSDEKKKQ